MPIALLVINLLLGLGSALPQRDRWDFESPWGDLPRWASDWSPDDVRAAFDRSRHQMTYHRGVPVRPLPLWRQRQKRDVSSPPSCASAWAKQEAEPALLGSTGQNGIANQYVESQRSGVDEYYSGAAIPYEQHPDLAPFQRFENAMMPDDVYQYFDGHSDFETPGLRGASASFIPAVNSRTVGAQQIKPVEDATVKQNQQYYKYNEDYRQQIQQALADGKQLNVGIPNQQLAPATPDLLLQRLGVSTPNFPVTPFSIDPQTIKDIYGEYYVPQILNLAQQAQPQPQSANPATVRDVLQYLLNQYQYGSTPVPVSEINGYRNQRLLNPEFAHRVAQIMDNYKQFNPIQRQSTPQLPPLQGNNQLLPPNMYRSGKSRWAPMMNLFVHDPVNLSEYEQMNQYARSTPCSRNKRQQDAWGYYPQLAPQTAVMSEMPGQYPQLGAESGRMAQPTPGQYPQLGPGAARIAQPLPGQYPPMYQDGSREQWNNFKQLSDLGRQLSGFIGVGRNQQYGNQPNPSFARASDAISGAQQMWNGFSQMMPMFTGN